MVRLSSPISSRLILAGFYAAFGGLLLYVIIYFYGTNFTDFENSSLSPSGFNYWALAVTWIAALGPVFGVMVTCIPFFPFTFIYASWVCPSRITVTNTEIRAKFFTGESRWHMSELREIKFQTANDKQFIIFKVGGKTLKAEVEHGRWGAIRDLIPPEISAKVPT